LSDVEGKAIYCGTLGTYTIWKKPKQVAWDNLSPHDWIHLLSSILLPSSEREIYSQFGAEKTKLEEILLELRMRYSLGINSDLSLDERMYRRKNDNPKEINFKEATMKVEMPQDLNNESHWGHLLFRYVDFCRKVEG
jgi:hypothetical protein